MARVHPIMYTILWSEKKKKLRDETTIRSERKKEERFCHWIVGLWILDTCTLESAQNIFRLSDARDVRVYLYILVHSTDSYLRNIYTKTLLIENELINPETRNTQRNKYMYTVINKWIKQIKNYKNVYSFWPQSCTLTFPFFSINILVCRI